MADRNSVFKIRYIFYFTAILLAFLSLASYSQFDSALLAGGVDGVPKNWIGKLGAVFSMCAFYLIGIAAYFLPVFALIRVIRLMLPEPGKFSAYFGGISLILAGFVLIFGLNPEMFSPLCERLGLGRSQVPQLALSGGTIGQLLAAPGYEPDQLSEGLLRNLIGAIGTMIFGWAMLAGGAVVIYISDWHKLIKEHLLVSQPPRRRAARQKAEAEEEEVFEEEEIFDSQCFLKPATDETERSAEEEAPQSRLHHLLSKFGHREQENGLADEESEEPEEQLAQETSRSRLKNLLAEINGEQPELLPEEPADEDREEKDTFVLPPEIRDTSVPVSSINRQVTEAGKSETAPVQAQYILPPVTMLSKGNEASGEDPKTIERATLILQRTLDSFKIPGEVVGYISGPSITRYEIRLADGVNVKKVEQIQGNFAMNLAAPSIRVLAPIPGRDVVGIEVPNSRRESVFMRSVMEGEEWNNGKAAIPVVLGKNVASTPIIIDLAKAPHLLIAGSTGSGKSVCMNTLIMSLLFRFNPEDLRLIMVDPKRVEFEDYRRLPHLITPVINDAKKVPVALRWAVTEMEHRYDILAAAGVKKLAEFNALSRNGEPIRDKDGKPVTDGYGRPISKMPILIVIIDELAELRMQDSWKDSETYIARIAQLGRAAGVHIVVATQRPSTNIITGVIKANLPTRIAFRVLQQIDSRVILDQQGAETLLGLGDMLALLPGAFGLDRIQGALVDDKDIKAIVKFVSDQRPQNFDENVIAEESEELEEGEFDRPVRKGESSSDDDDDVFDDMDRAEIAPLIKKYLHPGDDETMKKALEVVILDRKASTSYIQRRLKIGYNRAAELIDLMEERGIVGPPSGSGNKREILIFDGIEIHE